MKYKLLAGLCLISTVANADCHIRSSINIMSHPVNSGATDIQRFVAPDAQGFKCVLRYRIHIGDEWQTAEGIGYGNTEEISCFQALDARKGYLLTEVAPKQVGADTQMVCSDLVDIKIRSVRVGETIWESETDMHRSPKEGNYFKYKDATCRMFTERGIKDRNLYTYQGVICRATSKANSKWRVLDKY